MCFHLLLFVTFYYFITICYKIFSYFISRINYLITIHYFMFCLVDKSYYRVFQTDWITKSVKVEKTWVLVKGNSFVWPELCYVRIHSLFSIKVIDQNSAFPFFKCNRISVTKWVKGTFFCLKRTLSINLINTLRFNF